VVVRLRRRFTSCENGFGPSNPFNQICWIDLTLQIERVHPLASRGNRCKVPINTRGE
jgi:hypothetical protein